MRAQLDAATLALRTKERDEAEARRLAAEAQLASIESRVQPHFLFNTLNSIAALVHDDPDGAERMTGQLASLLRSALDSTATPLVTARRGTAHRRARISTSSACASAIGCATTMQLGDGTASAAVPRMALQTLVENSVKYAVSPRREGGSIRRDRQSGRRPRPHHGRRRRAGVRCGEPAGRPRSRPARRAPGDAVRRRSDDAGGEPAGTERGHPGCAAMTGSDLDLLKALGRNEKIEI